MRKAMPNQALHPTGCHLRVSLIVSVEQLGGIRCLTFIF
jgi:hypothetical protein